MKKIQVNTNDANQRIDKFLQKYFKNMPLPMIYKYIRKKRVKVNGKKVELSYKLQENDEIDLYINDEFFEEITPQEAYKSVKANLDIVYEDENIMLIDKKPGMVVHPDEHEQVNTLIAHIQSYLYEKGEYRPELENTFAPSLCNRIDRNTGGIVIAAKNAETLRVVNEKIKTKEIQKFYLCIVQGKLAKKQGELTGYLIKNQAQNRVYILDKPAKDARNIITRYKVLQEHPDMSLLEVELITGRTHQIRAHFASIGHPLIGDGKYGKNVVNKAAGFRHQALYSYKLKFNFQEGGILHYLKGKTFQVDKVDFAEKF